MRNDAESVPGLKNHGYLICIGISFAFSVNCCVFCLFLNCSIDL